MMNPAELVARLEEIERDLETRGNLLEEAAQQWYVSKRHKEKARAVAFLSASGTVAERQATADQQTATDGVQEEALYESLKAVVRTLEARASIAQTLCRVNGRG